MSDIGVRELKARASEIVHAVREDGARYTVTHRGRPVAVLVPVDEASAPAPTSADPWEELVEIGAEISASWGSARDSAELLSEMRR